MILDYTFLRGRGIGVWVDYNEWRRWPESINDNLAHYDPPITYMGTEITPAEHMREVYYRSYANNKE